MMVINSGATHHRVKTPGKENLPSVSITVYRRCTASACEASHQLGEQADNKTDVVPCYGLGSGRRLLPAILLTPASLHVYANTFQVLLHYSFSFLKDRVRPFLGGQQLSQATPFRGGHCLLFRRIGKMLGNQVA
jgi:hypothetical protein